MPIYVVENKTHKSQKSTYKTPPVRSFSSGQTLTVSNLKNQNKNINNTSKNLSDISSIDSGSNEALAEIADLEYDFNYKLEDISSSSNDNDNRKTTLKTNPKEHLNESNFKKLSKVIPKPKWTKYDSTKSSSSEKEWPLKNSEFSCKVKHAKKKVNSDTLHTSSSDWSLDYSFIFKYMLKPLSDLVKFSSLSKKQRELFNFLLGFLLLLVFILVVFYYFLSIIFSSSIATKVKIENENIYIRL